jgi:tRNA pseudouridine55 synthase
LVDGFLVVDKPSGPTSHDMVAAVRRATGIRRAGHAGTLDPMASGVVVVALGRATRLLRFLQDRPKEYEATALFGVATDTLDAEGAVVSEQSMETLTASAVEAALPAFTGTIRQVPPMVSALKHEGRRLYRLAREGVEVERAARPVEVHRLELIEFRPGLHPEVAVRVVCGKGTYVRSLLDDLAVSLGGRAHLTALRRTRSGTLGAAEHGISPDDLAERWRERLVTPAVGLDFLPAITADAATTALVRTGRRLAARGGREEGPYRVLDPDGVLLAVYRDEADTAIPEVVLA